MLCGYTAIGLLIIVVIVGIIIYIKNEKQNEKQNQKQKQNQITENFLALDETKLNENLMQLQNPNDNKPVEIQYQIPVSANQLSTNELKSIDTDILRNTRVLANFSMTDEFNFYQIYSLLKNFKNQEYKFNYINEIDTNKKSKILNSEKLITINSGAINKTDLELFTRLKLELISAFNSIIIKNEFYIPYHPFQFFKIINSNMISNTIKTSTANSFNFVFTLTIAREYKYQQFVIYYDVDLIADSNSPQSTQSPQSPQSPQSIIYTIKMNKVELIGIPIPNTIEFHPNQKTSKKLTDSITDPILEIIKDPYYQDQVSDSANFDVMPIADPSIRNNSPSVKYIDITETSDMDNTIFDQNSLSTKIEDKIMNISRDQQFNNHRCYGLVNGISQELPQYKNPIFCKSFHPDINQNGIWDSPCQVNSDCPFYKANKNYPNEFGKCDKVSGQCEMPMGVTPIGFTKIGKIEPNCYNCNINSIDSKCCGNQYKAIKDGLVSYKSPDYVFVGDEFYRKQFENDIKAVGLLVNPSL